MKTYKIITIKQGITQGVDKLAGDVEKTLNEKCNAGWELVDINWCSYSSAGGITAFLTFRY